MPSAGMGWLRIAGNCGDRFAQVALCALAVFDRVLEGSRGECCAQGRRRTSLLGRVWSVWMTMAVVMGESVNLVSASLAAMRTQTAHCFQAASLVIANFEAANQTVSVSCLLETGLQSV